MSMTKLPKLWWRYTPMAGGPLVSGSSPPIGPGEMVLTQGSGYTSLQDYILKLNPLAYWPLNDPAGSLTAKDITGNGFNGTVSGAVTLGSAGLTTFGETCASFTGGAITTPDVPNPPSYSRITIYQDGQGAGSGTYAGMTQDSLEFFNRSAVQIYTTFNGGGGSYSMPINTAVNTYVETLQSSVQASYINGSVFKSGAVTAPVTGTAPVILGSPTLFGKLAHVAILPYAMTAAQITALQNVINAGPKYQQWQGSDTSGTGIACWTISSRNKWRYAQPTIAGGFKIMRSGYFESDLMTFDGPLPNGIFTVSGTPLGRLFVQT